MYTVWHVDKYKVTFKLVINSRRTSRGPVTDRGPAVEKHCSRLLCCGQLCLRGTFYVYLRIRRLRLAWN